jgi:predicted transglutaminase-like cysteine proteinase
MRPAAVVGLGLWAWVAVAGHCAAATGTPSAADPARLQAHAQRLGGAAAAAWPGLSALLQPLPLPVQAQEHPRLEAINRFFNQGVRWRSDADLWGQDDFWTTPLQLLARGAGDCEDYAIAKYAALRAAGVPEQHLRLVYAQLGARDDAPGAALAYARAALPATARGPAAVAAAAPQAHMVLAYQPAPDAPPLILDNLRDDIAPASARPDLVPIFSFNRIGLWRGTGGAAAGDPLQRLPRWRELLERLAGEGW